VSEPLSASEQCQDLGFLWLFLGAVRDDDAAAASRFLLDSLDEDMVVQRV
jgi:hypothetical protein